MTPTVAASPSLLPVAAAVAALLAMTPLAMAQTASSTPVPTATEWAQVVVTGTRRANRTVAESESPVDVLSARDLQSTGATELATVLGQLLPSLNFPRPSVTDASDAVRPAQLRGLSPDQTLVLVNGKRRHTTAVVNINGSQGRGSSPVDLNAIPVAAIERIEVLRDGAAAQYGSDAIAGVINIILKKGAKGGNVSIDAAQSDEGDGRRLGASASLGFDLGGAGWARLSAEVRDQDFSNRAGVETIAGDSPARAGKVNFRFGDPDSTQAAAVLNAQFTLSPALEAYGFVTLSQRDTSAAAFWRKASTAAANGVPALYPDGFLPLEESTTTDFGLVAGLRGDVARWRWDASLNHGRNEFKIDVANTANYSLGAASPTRFYAGALTNQQTLANLDGVRELELGLASPLTLALGAELRRERYDIGAGEPNSYQGGGASGFPGFQEVNAGSHSRTSAALYVNAESQLTRQFSGAAALRAEHYSDFGNATSAKLSGRYVFTPAVALRGTASTGFRAPSLAQQFFTTTSTNLINGALVEAGTFPVGSAAGQALGAVPLKAETSRNLGLGLVINPTSQFQSALDVYRIDIDDRILLSANMSLPAALRAQLAAQGVVVSAGRYFTNALDTRTDGIDWVNTLRQDWQGGGSADFTVAYNHTRNTVRQVAANPAVLSANGLTLIDRVTLARATVSSPKDKVLLAAEHVLGAWSARLAATRYGSFEVRQSNPVNDQVFGAAWVGDVSVGWRGRAWNASVGVDNFNDAYPDLALKANTNNGTLPYSSFSPFGFNGRQFYARAGYSW
jgi:iron complex outermembrane receptor protein